MNKLNILVSLLAISFLVGFSSCKKVEGCTDSNSPTYNVEAEKDDGSCVSVADAMTGTWNASETAAGITQSYDVTIAKVDDNTILITEKDRIASPLFTPDSYEVDLNWATKMVTSTNDIYTGTIGGENSIDVNYTVVNSSGLDFTVAVKYTR